MTRGMMGCSRSAPFSLENRSDTASSSLYGFEVGSYKRVSEIQAKIDGSWVRKFSLGYSAGDNGVRSLLSSITDSGKAENGNVTTLPAVTFGYIPDDSFVAGGGDQGVRLADVNGDGFDDMLHGYKQTGGSDIQKVYINNGDGTGWTKVRIRFCHSISSEMARTEALKLADVDGDGLVDLIKGKMEIGSRQSAGTHKQWH